MRFSYVVLCGVNTYFFAVLRCSYPPPNRRRDAAHNLVAYLRAQNQTERTREIWLRSAFEIPFGNLPHFILNIVFKLL